MTDGVKEKKATSAPEINAEARSKVPNNIHLINAAVGNKTNIIKREGSGSNRLN
jgi:hypothetical protein